MHPVTAVILASTPKRLPDRDVSGHQAPLVGWMGEGVYGRVRLGLMHAG